MAFVITRVDDTLFDFQLDGGDIRTDDKPRLTTFNNLCDFKTANGANLYQRIALNTIMVVDTFGGSGTFTFISVLELRQKLKELKFFEGANGNGAGSGVDRFDNLLDAFQYFENAGKVAIVNPSETGLIASEFYNINRSTQLVDFPSTLIAGKWLQVANDGLSFTFIDPIEQPEPYVNAVGWVIYDNNEASPINYVSGLEQLTNNTAGFDTNVDNLPFGVSNLWDNGLNELDFSQLSLNDMVDLSLKTTVTTNSINQNCKIYLKVAIGSASEKTILLNDLTFATVDTYDILSRLNFAIINSDYKDFPAQILFESNDTADVYLENIYISATRKDANYAILEAVDSTASHNKGNYDVTTNTPTLSNGSGQIGDYYTLTTAGTRDFGAGNITFGIGDRIEYNGGIWFKAIDNSQGMGALDNTADHDKGDYNATTNTPTLIDGTGQIGDYYKVTVAGTVDLGSGNIILQVDDIIGYDGSVWYKKVNNNQSSGGVTSIDTLNGVQTLGGITASLTEKVTIVDDDLIGGADSEATNASKKWKFSTIATYVLSKLGAYLWALSAKTTPVDADTITINDTADSNNLKKVTLTNLWVNYLKPLVQTKRTHTVIFSHSGSTSNFTDWYTKTRSRQSFGAITYTAYTGLTPTNDFADDTYFGFNHVLPFACKIKSCFVIGSSNIGVAVPIDIAIQTIELPNPYNTGAPTSGTNPKIVARETVTQPSTTFNPNVKFASGSLDTTHNIAENSICKMFFKNDSGASGSIELSVLVEFEEL